MSTPLFVDTGVLLSSVDDRDPARQARARRPAATAVGRGFPGRGGGGQLDRRRELVVEGPYLADGVDRRLDRRPTQAGLAVDHHDPAGRRIPQRQRHDHRRYGGNAS